MATRASCAVALEVLPVRLHGGLEYLLTDRGRSLRLDWPSGASPHAAAVAFTRQLGLTPLVCHSTSWRSRRRRLLITYLVAVEGAAPRGCAFRPIRPAELPRGSTLDAPVVIDELDVVRHVLAHLAWLTDTDCVIREALTSWGAVLASFTPEAFRGFVLPEHVAHLARAATDAVERS